MKPGDILRRTAEGSEEIDAKRHKLPSRARYLLFMLDGRKSVGQLSSECAQFGDVPSLLTELVARGLAEFLDRAPGKASPPAAERDWRPAMQDRSERGGLQAAKRELAVFVENALGTDGKELIERISSCHGEKELEEILEICRGIVSAVAGERKAEQFVAGIRATMKQER
jgi:hypothetical protein